MKQRNILNLLFMSSALLATLATISPAHAAPGDAYKRGVEYRKGEKFAAALQQFNLAIQQDPKFLDAYVQRIELYCSIDQAAKALDDCNKAIALAPAGDKRYAFYTNVEPRPLNKWNSRSRS